MKKQNIVISLLLVALLFLNLSVKPYLRRRDAIRIIKTVLTHWGNDDLMLAMPYWEKEIDSPPIYDLLTSEIIEGKIGKKDGVHIAQITATLEFPPGNPFYSGKKWIFELNKTRYGWKIMDYSLSEN